MWFCGPWAAARWGYEADGFRGLWAVAGDPLGVPEGVGAAAEGEHGLLQHGVEALGTRGIRLRR